MVSGWKALLGVIGFSLAAIGPGLAQDLPARHSTAPLAGHTSVPYGWVDFCRRYAGECDGPAMTPEDVALTTRSWRDLTRIDLLVNRTVTPMTDMEHWGVVDQWDYPTDGKGDCEDYVLEKRRQLIAAGYPRQALLVTVVKDHAGEGHAVLTVKTDRGDFVLDNMVDAVLAWDQTGYKFVKRQSQADPNVWDAIAPATTAPLYTAR